MTVERQEVGRQAAGRRQRLKAVERAVSSTKILGPAYSIAKGMGITLRTMLRRSVTVQYPLEKPDLPPRTRGVIALQEENCTVCMLCSRECPDWCIYIESHKDKVPPKTPGARSRTRNVLDRFAIDYALCMYCGICVEVCPFDALFWSPHFEYSETDVGELTHEMDVLGTWMDGVLPPPPLEEGAEEPAEAGAEAKVLGGAPVAEAPTGQAPAAPSAEAPAPEGPAAPAPAAGEAVLASGEAAPAEAPAPAAEDHGPPEVDEEVYQRELAAGKPERVARALAKKASMLKRRKGGA